MNEHANEAINCHQGADCKCSRRGDAAPTYRSIVITPDGDVRVEGVTLEAWPDPATFIVHAGNRCLHVTISAHVSRPLKAEA
ncbi:MAG TPA: hypothetical protein VF761_17195 [Gemmatimonadaceae bacterium]